jgi:hypothetical protein
MPFEIPEVLVTPDDNRPYNHGGTADAWNPHGQTDPYYGFLVDPGKPTNHDPVSGGGGDTGASTSSYYHSYWAGVQAEMYGGAFAVDRSGLGFLDKFLHPYAPDTRVASSELGVLRNKTPMFTPAGPLFPDILDAARHRMQNLEAGKPLSISDVNPNKVYPDAFIDIIPTPPPPWFTGLFGQPASPSGQPASISLPDGMLSGTPIAGAQHFGSFIGEGRSASAFQTSPTEQEILDAGNPALWLSPRLVGPMVPLLSSPGPGPDDMTPVFAPTPTTSTLIPFDITPGNTISDVTPGS